MNIGEDEGGNTVAIAKKMYHILTDQRMNHSNLKSDIVCNGSHDHLT